MNGLKAISIEKFARKQKLRFIRFECRGHGKSDGKFDDFTIADLDLYFLTNMISSGKFDYIPPSYLNTYPNMVELNETIAKHPICTNWMSEVMATSGAKL